MITFLKSLRAPTAVGLSVFFLGCTEEVAAPVAANQVGVNYPHPVESVTGSPYQAASSILDNRQGVERDVSRARGPNASLRGQPVAPAGTNVGQKNISSAEPTTAH